MFVNGSPCWAFPDNYAGANVMSETFAKSHNCAVQNGEGETFCIPNGNLIRAMGRVYALCRFAEEDEVFLEEFQILKVTEQPLIMGGPFLRATNTLTNRSDRMQHRSPDRFWYRSEQLSEKFATSSWRLLRKHYCTRYKGINQRLICHFGEAHNRKLVLAVPDIGSSINAMSLAFASTFRYHIDRT